MLKKVMDAKWNKQNGCKNNKILQFIEEVKIYEVIYKLNKRWDRKIISFMNFINLRNYKKYASLKTF